MTASTAIILKPNFGIDFQAYPLLVGKDNHHMELKLKPKTRIKRLFWDLEVSPNVVLAWRAGYDQTINHDSIIKERKIICVGYKWQGERTQIIQWDKKQDDKGLLEQFLPILDEADESCGHFLDRFDWPWFRTRCLIHGLPSPHPQKTIDTKAWASKNYYFNSNKLDYIGGVLGLGHKLHTTYDLWKDILLKDCPKAMNKMTTYCKRDVELLEQVYERLAVHVKPKTHAGVMAGSEKWTCPRCGGSNVIKSKTRITAAGTITHQMRCADDGGYFSINDATYKKYIEMKKKKGKGKKC